MEIRFKLSEDFELTLDEERSDVGDFNVKPFTYGVVLDDDAGMWSFVVTYTSRQDGLSMYGATLVQVDDRVYSENKMVRSADLVETLELELRQLTQVAGWMEPVNEES